jgi:hypothetical protein
MLQRPDGVIALSGGSSAGIDGLSIPVSAFGVQSCDYTASVEGRIVDPAAWGWGLVAHAGLDGTGQPHGHGLQYQYLAGYAGIQLVEYAHMYALPALIPMSTDLEWHTLTIHVHAGTTTDEVDGHVIASSHTDAPCGDVFIRLWSPGEVDIRNIHITEG